MTKSKIKVALFSSFYRGYHLLAELLNGSMKDRFEIVGVATDDVGQKFIFGDKRGLPVYTGRVKSDTFYEIYEQQWRPDLCTSGTFGQRIDARLFEFPKFGFFNTRPCEEDDWPSRYAGPNPFHALREDGHDHTTAALHRVDSGFDTGELIAMSQRIAMRSNARAVAMHKLTTPVIAKFAVPELTRLAGVPA